MNIDDYYAQYVSNTLAGTSNQLYYNQGVKATAYAFYRIFDAGQFDYSLLYTNTIDSTYADGSISKRNDPCGKWYIESLSVSPVNEITTADLPEIQLTFNGKKSKIVLPDEIFFTDKISLNVKQNEYLRVKIVYNGEKIPCHIENQIPTFKNEGDGVKANKLLPLPSMIGVNRKIEKRIVFWGDSITQGIGCKENSYLNYCAICANALGIKYSFWNLGIGYGRATDAATNKAWAKKAVNCDTAIVCFGVNDIFRVGDYRKIIAAYNKIIKILSGKQIIFQCIPPFDYTKEQGKLWLKLNKYIKNEISKKVFAVFDPSPILSDEKDVFHAKYGGHPNEDGSFLWGKALYDFLKVKL